MSVQKTSRITVRITDVQRGKLAEEAGPYGNISAVVRALIVKHVNLNLAKRKKG